MDSVEWILLVHIIFYLDTAAGDGGFAAILPVIY